MGNYQNYLIKELRSEYLEIEYDGYLKNIHPSLTFRVHCKIDDSSPEGASKWFEVPPLSEIRVMSHSCGPCMENEFNFEVLEIQLA